MGADNAAASSAERVGEFVHSFRPMRVPMPTSVRPDGGDVPCIGDDIKGLNYRLSKCCNPIYGDDVFGSFPRKVLLKSIVPIGPNALHIRENIRIVLSVHAGAAKSAHSSGATLRVVGKG